MLMISGKSGAAPSTNTLLGHGQVSGKQAVSSGSMLSGTPSGENLPSKVHTTTNHQMSSNVNSASGGMPGRRYGDVKQQPTGAPGAAATSRSYSSQSGGRLKSAALHSKRNNSPHNK
jgi:hypothetical protein